MTSRTITILVAAALLALVGGSFPSQASATKTLYEKFFWACDRKQWQFALKFLDKLMAQSPKEAQLYSDRARIMLEQQQYKKAISDCDKAMSLGLKDSTVYRRRGYCFLMLGDYKKGAADLETAIIMHPTMRRCSPFTTMITWLRRTN
jgi:tetratricopeptide (TPR) repeat protein